MQIDFASSVSGIENEILAKGRDRFDEWHRIPSGPMHGVNPIKLVISAGRVTWGMAKALLLLRRTKPDAIFLTGGWAGLPIAIAGTVLHLPMAIFVPDVEPGRTLKLLGRFATVITATTTQTAQFYPGKQVIETGYPLRSDLVEATRKAAIERFGLDPDKRTLLVFGGSRGSRAINHAIFDHLSELFEVADLQILHISGKLDAEAMRTRREALPNEIKDRYHLYDYIDEFGFAMAAADLVVSRAGASIMGELPVFDLPSILIPLAYEWRYQEVNADYMASHNAAIRLDESLMADQLAPLIISLLTDNEKMQKLRDGVQSLARTDGADNIAQVLLSLAN